MGLLPGDRIDNGGSPQRLQAKLSTPSALLRGLAAEMNPSAALPRKESNSTNDYPDSLGPTCSSVGKEHEHSANNQRDTCRLGNADHRSGAWPGHNRKIVEMSREVLLLQ